LQTNVEQAAVDYFGHAIIAFVSLSHTKVFSKTTRSKFALKIKVKMLSQVTSMECTLRLKNMRIVSSCEK